MFLLPTNFVVAPAHSTEYLLKCIEDFCLWARTDFVLNAYSYKCTSYSQQYEFSFNINLYTDPVAHHTIIEFQRWSGDDFGFSDVFRAARYYLNTTDLVEGGIPIADSTRKTFAELKPPTSVAKPTEDPTVIKESVRNMLNSCMASFSDVQSQSVIAMAHFSEQHMVQEALYVYPTAVYQFICLLNPDITCMPDTYRCAAATLNNILSRPELGTTMAEKIHKQQGLLHVDKIIAKCQITQVLRECAALLHYVVTYLGDMVKDDLKAMNLAVLLEHPDPTIQGHIAAVREKIA